MSSNIGNGDGARARDPVNELLDRVFADDPKFLESFIRSSPTRRSEVVSEALRSDDADALWRLKTALEDTDKQASEH